jgi:hypothetical protein
MYLTGRRQELQLYAKALEKGYRISDELRAQVIETARALLNSPQERSRLLACRVILAADQTDIRREANVVADRGNDLRAAASILRDAQRNPKLRKAMRDAMKAAESEAADPSPQLPSPPADTSTSS